MSYITNTVACISDFTHGLHRYAPASRPLSYIHAVFANQPSVRIIRRYTSLQELTSVVIF